MKKYVKASLVDTFLKYHDDENNYQNNRDGFDRMYSILEKYDDSNGNDSVDIPFQKAPVSEQKKMIDLISPQMKPGQKGYAQKLYYDALEGSFDNSEYCLGIIDAIEALFEEGWILESAFRTDL